MGRVAPGLITKRSMRRKEKLYRQIFGSEKEAMILSLQV